MLLSKVFLSIALSQLCWSLSARAYTDQGIVMPANGLPYAVLYSLPGFNPLSCLQYIECVQLAQIQSGAKVKLLGETSAFNKPSGEQDFKPKRKSYYRVEYESNAGDIKRGYINTRDMQLPNDKSTEAAFCIDGENCNPLNKKGLAQLSEDLISTSTFVLRDLDNRYKFSPACKNFINEKGELGEWGRKVLASMDRADASYKKQNGKSCFYDDMNMSDVCPRFKNFAMRQKELFWVYLYASLAQDESSCRKNISAKGVNGLADGLLQLEYSSSLRKGSNRDKVLCKSNSPVDTRDLDFQFNCSASIFRDVNCKKRLKKVSYSAGYWQELRGKHSNVSKFIKEFPGCY